MEKRIYNEQTGISYTLQGDYYLPDLKLPDQEDKPIGLWGQRHLRYIKQHRKILYVNLLTSGKLSKHLADIDKQAEDILFRLVKQMAEREGVTEKLCRPYHFRGHAQCLYLSDNLPAFQQNPQADTL